MTVPQTIADAAARFRAGTLSARDLTEASLDAIARGNPRFNAFILVDAEGARAAADDADRERRAGTDRGPLHGIPISLKDLIDVAGQPTTAAARALGDRVATRDASVVTRLREAGVVMLGKTNLHEFALGTTSEESAFGPVRNPNDVTRSAGGSSGGSAVAVATGMGLASIGSDTGGSIRIPAAACGTVGLKPSLGEVPTAGVVPLSVTLDHVGPLARSVQDAAWLWTALSGRHADSQPEADARSLTLGRLDGYFAVPSGNEVHPAFEQAIAALGSRGVRIVSRSLPDTAKIVETYVNIVLPEGAWWHGAMLDERAEGYTPAVRSRFLAGRDTTAVQYLEARHARLAWRRAVDAALDGCDALVLPTLPIVAPVLGSSEVTIDPAQDTRIPVRTAMLKHTQLFNITGHPAISLPVPVSGLPVGLQLVGRRADTARLLAVAAACERAIGA